MDSLVQGSPLTLAAAALLGVLAVARATRLWIYDEWPPMVWVRERFTAWAEQTRHVPAVPARPGNLGRAGYERETWRLGWLPLVKCPFCVAPWFALASIVWAWAAGLDGRGWSAVWWLTHLWFAVSYLAAMVVVRDEPPDDA